MIVCHVQTVLCACGSKGGVVATVHMHMKSPFPDPGSATDYHGSTNNSVPWGATETQCRNAGP